MSTTLRERFTALIDARTEPGRRFNYLSAETGADQVSALSWRKAFNGGQRPTAEMLETLARLWPEHSFWLLTGATDNRNGHVSPDHGEDIDVPFVSRPAAAEFFRIQAEAKSLGQEDRRNLIQRLYDAADDAATALQKRNGWMYGGQARLHPDLALGQEAKSKKAIAAKERAADFRDRLVTALRKRDAETKAIYGDQEV